MAGIPRMRLISEAYDEIKAQDPDTAIKRTYFRSLVVDGTIPSTKIGNKYLVNMDIVLQVLGAELGTAPDGDKGDGKVRYLADR